MAFVVQTDGAIIEDATSYVDLAFADDYASDSGNTAWAAKSSGEKQILLVRATRWIDSQYGPRFKGHKFEDLQPLEWPRADVAGGHTLGYLTSFDSIVPLILKKAVCEMALYMINSDPNVAVTVSEKRVKVDVIETEYEGGFSSRVVELPVIKGLLSAILKASGNVIRA